METKEGEGPPCFGLLLLPFARGDGAKGAEGGERFAPAQRLKPWKGSREPRSPHTWGWGKSTYRN